MLTPAIEVARLSKSFAARGRDRRQALADLSFEVMPGEMVALIGASGSGKTTLLRLIAGLTEADRKPGGAVAVHGALVQRGGRVAHSIRHRRREVGVIFQQFNLVDRLSVLTNVLAGMLARVPTWRTLSFRFTAAEKRAAFNALDRVGIADLAYQRASTLSGGQQQRAAIARALVQHARVILADEPIASLDPESSRRIMDLLQRINNEDGITVLVSLHQVEQALAYCPRIIGLRTGEIVYDGPSAALTPELLQGLYGGDAGASTSPPRISRRAHRDAARQHAGSPAAAGAAGI